MNKRNFLIIFSTHTVYSTILVIRETMLLMVMGTPNNVSINLKTLGYEM